jgi:RNA-directed DNA polymerase
MLAWYGLGYTQATKSKVVNYADDFVVLCKPGHGEQAMRYPD